MTCCLDGNVHVVRKAKQDAGVPEPDTVDASRLLGNKRPKILKCHAMFEALNAESIG